MNQTDPEKIKNEFLKAYDVFADPIFRYCYAKTRNRDKATDLVQDTFTRVWQYLADGKEVEQMKPFLYRIATNAIIDGQRKKKESSLDALMEEGYDYADESDAADTHETLFESNQAMEILSGLDEKYKEVLLMRYVEDMSVKDIAHAIGESENNTSVRIHRGLDKLKKAMKEKFPPR
ncbi:MAG: RNA polymerase sigma factor [Candidatus Pacebacteria bacterium]|jgi:RNA polymerase sigma-70 factor (ECF subfamily)|nr:RNA polymerase sigma factor [Candidatus Paceibacterota bacterium]